MKETGVVFVVADEQGHALAVVAALEQARQAARDDAKTVASDMYQGDDVTFEWTIRVDERSPQWTRLTARLNDPGHDQPFAEYMITELVAAEEGTFRQVAPRPEITIVRTELLVKEQDTGDWQPADGPAGAEPPADAATSDDASPAVAAPQAATDAPETAESAEPPSDPAFDVLCEGRYEGCAVRVENEKQLQLSRFKQRADLCNSCYRHEVRNNIGPRAA